MAVNTFKLEFDDGVTKSIDVKIVGPKDIIMFVAGTTDTGNTKGLKHEANNEGYWRSEECDFDTFRNSLTAINEPKKTVP